MSEKNEDVSQGMEKQITINVKSMKESLNMIKNTLASIDEMMHNEYNLP